MQRIAVLAILPLLAEAADLAVGGRISPSSALTCQGNPFLDFSRDGDGETIATCTIRSNAPWFEATFRLGPDFPPARGASPFRSLTFHGIGGVLGQGLLPPGGEDILPRMAEGIFTWAPGEQRTSTLDYVLEFRASWKARPKAGPTPVAVTAELASAL